MAVRLRKALDTAKEYKACKPEVDEIVKFWGKEFGTVCPYDPKHVAISEDATKTLLVPQQQAQNYESRAKIYDNMTLSHVDKDGGNKSLFVTHIPRKGVKLKESPHIDEDKAVLQIRLALLAASHKADGTVCKDGEKNANVDQELQIDVDGDKPKGEARRSPLKGLVRGTRTTLLQIRQRKLKEASEGTPIALTHMASHPIPNSEQQSCVIKPCSDLQELALFVAPDENHNPYAARRPSTPHPTRFSSRGSTAGKTPYVPKKKFSLKTAPPALAFSKGAMLERARSKLKSRTLSKIPSIAESVISEHEVTDRNCAVETFKVGDTVEARYRGRTAWLLGKITRCQVNGTYDISYLSFDEKGVRPEFIRHKTLDVRRVKAKLRISGMLATALRTEGAEPVEVPKASPQPTKRKSVYLQTSPGKIKVIDQESEKVAVTEVTSMSSIKLRRNASYVEGIEPDPEPITPVVKIDGKKAWKGALAKGLLATSVPNGTGDILTGPPSPSDAPGWLSRRTHVASAEDEQKELLAAIAEKEKKKQEEHENIEKARLWAEMQRLVTKYNCEIKAKDLAVTTLLGRGKFAAVHIAKLRLHDVPHSSLNDPNDHNHNDTLSSSDPWTLELDVGIKVTQFKNALPLPTAFGSRREKKKKKSGIDMDNYSDDEFEEENEEDNDGDELDIEHLPPSRVILEYLREVRTLYLLKHENIVGIHGVVLKPRLAVLLQLMDGKNLHQHLKDTAWQVSLRRTVK